MNLRKLAVIPMLAATLGLAACAGGGRPSVDELKHEINDQFDKVGDQAGMKLGDDEAQCLAEKLHSSDLSDKTLREMADGKDKLSDRDEEKKAQDVIMEGFNDCVKMPAQ